MPMDKGEKSGEGEREDGIETAWGGGFLEGYVP